MFYLSVNFFNHNQLSTMKYQLVLWILALSLLTISCKESINAPTSEVKDQIQLKIGNEWSYRDYLVDTLQNVVLSSAVRTIKIERDTLINREVWYVDNFGIIRTSRRDGLYIWNDGKEMVDIKVNLGVGDFYFIQTTVPPSMTIANLKTDIIETDRQVTTPSGIYRCQVQQREGREYVMNMTLFIDKRLGLVKTEATSTYRPIKLYSELIAFKMK
jgi:hypothetical protein